MKLALLRHGIAIDREHPDCPDDPDRFLTEIGITKTVQALRGFAQTDFSPEVIITSPYVRARQTAEIAARELGYDAGLEEETSLIWMMPPSKIVGKLAKRREKTILLSGHAPHLDELVAYLCGAKRAFTSMKKASVALIECLEVDKGGGYLMAYYPPRLLRGLAD